MAHRDGLSGPAGGGPLEGIKVLDFTRFQNGPSATRTLADYGCIVIKVENPKGGDEMRGLTKMKDGYSVGVQYHNRGKQSLTLDLRNPASRPVMERLVKWADVITENFKPGTLDSYGYTYEQCKEWNPKIIYCTNSGFGDRGPMGHLGSFDGVAQAFTGVMMAQGGGPGGNPQPVDFAFSDEVGAMSFVQGILMALVYKERSGKGQKLVTSQVGATIQFQGANLAIAMHVDRQVDNPTPGYVAPKWMANQYKCSDGKWFQLQAYNIVKLMIAVGREDMAKDERSKGMKNRNKHNDWIITELQKTFATQPRDHWLEIIEKTNTGPAGPVHSYMELMEHEQLWSNGYLVKQTDGNIPGAKKGGDVTIGKAFRFSESPAGPVERGPELGEHNDKVLKETLGFSQSEVDALAKANATTTPPKSKM